MLNIIIGAGVGLVLGYIIRQAVAKTKVESAENRASKIVDEAKSKEKDLLIRAKEKALKVIDDAKSEESERRKEITNLQKRLEKRESLFDQKLLDFEDKKQILIEKAEEIKKVREETEKIKDEQVEKLQQVANMTQKEAEETLLTKTEEEVGAELLSRIRKIENEAEEKVDAKAKEMLTLAIERCVSSHAAEKTSSSVTLPSDEMKGRVIGREGRNIKALENLLGVEIVIDDTPETLLVSAFSPIRRQVAVITLQKLISDGRIHPGRIEEVVEEAKKELAIAIKKAGEDAVYNLGIAGLDPKLVQVLGRLKYRTSYGQNVLQHSIEVAHLSALLAEELGANVAMAKKAGLLHDIGKAVDHEIEGTHPEIGYNILKKYGLPEEICKVARDHHEDHPDQLESIIVKVADAISAARLGARSDSYEDYLQRLSELEDIAKEFGGVEKAYAIQAGREIRVFVEPEEIDDYKAKKLAREIANKIENDLKYPGEIKVNVIRETRVMEYAR